MDGYRSTKRFLLSFLGKKSTIEKKGETYAREKKLNYLHDLFFFVCFVVWWSTNKSFARESKRFSINDVQDSLFQDRSKIASRLLEGTKRFEANIFSRLRVKILWKFRWKYIQEYIDIIIFNAHRCIYNPVRYSFYKNIVSTQITRDNRLIQTHIRRLEFSIKKKENNNKKVLTRSSLKIEIKKKKKLGMQ